MKASLNLGNTTSFTLRKALLVYEEENHFGQGNGATAVSVHEVTTGRNRQPTLGPGTAITRGAVESLAAALGRNLEACFLPPNVISLSFGQIAWFCPAGKRRIWFKADGRFDGGRAEEGAELKESMKTTKLNGKFAQHPPLLFIAGTQLRVFSLTRNERPKADTAIYRAPYWNLWESGAMCAGNRAMTEITTPSSIPSYEDAFFNSAFSHTNITKICRHPKGHTGLWEELSKVKRAPDHKYWSTNLFPLKRSLNSLLTKEE